MSHQNILAANLITAIKTPFDHNGKIDIDAFDRLIKAQIKAGTQGIIVGGTTGEGHLLDWEEHIMLIAHSANQFGDKLVIIGNTGSNNTREAIKATEYGFASGMHASLLINPYYGKTTPDGVKAHLNAALEIGPGIIYNVEARTGQDISPNIVQEVANHKNFVGVKECGGNEKIGYYESRGIACWSGNDDECHAGRHHHQSHGVISVTSNIVPELMAKLMSEQNDELNASLQPLFQWLFTEPNPIGINTALSMTGAISPVFRLPYLPLTKELRKEGLEILNTIGGEYLVGDSLSLLDDKEFRIVI